MTPTCGGGSASQHILFFSFTLRPSRGRDRRERWVLLSLLSAASHSRLKEGIGLMFSNALAKAQAKFAGAPAADDVCPNGNVHATSDGKVDEAVFALG